MVRARRRREEFGSLRRFRPVVDPFGEREALLLDWRALAARAGDGQPPFAIVVGAEPSIRFPHRNQRASTNTLDAPCVEQFKCLPTHGLPPSVGLDLRGLPSHGRKLLAKLRHLRDRAVTGRRPWRCRYVSLDLLLD